MHILSRPDIHIVKVCSFKPYFDLILLCSSIFEGKEEQIVLLHGRLMYHSMSDVIFGDFCMRGLIGWLTKCRSGDTHLSELSRLVLFLMMQTWKKGPCVSFGGVFASDGCCMHCH